MKHNGAIAIILTMIIVPFMGWAGSKLFRHETRISKNEMIHKRLDRIEQKLDRAPWVPSQLRASPSVAPPTKIIPSIQKN